MIIHASNSILSVTEIFDPEAKLYYTFYLKPPIWVANQEYVQGDIISPPSPTGYYYKVTSGGITGSTSPTFATTKGSITEDNSVKYKAVNNDAYITSNGSLNISTAVFSTTENVPLSFPIFTSAGKASVQVGPIPADVTSFILKLSFESDTGHAEEDFDERSILIKVKDR